MENIFIIIWLLFASVIGQILILFIGFTFFHLIIKKDHFPVLQKFAICYGLGSGFLALSMFFSIWIGIHSRLSFIPILIITCFCFFYFKMFKLLRQDIKSIFRLVNKLKLNYLELFCVLLILIELFLMFSYCYIYPIYATDAWVLWDWKAKSIFYDGNFNYIINRVEVQDFHTDYPNFQPLLSCFFYSLMLQPHHFVTFTFMTFFVFLLLFVYYSLRRFNLNRTYSILLITVIALYPSLFLYVIFAYADPTLTFFYTLSSILLYYFITKKEESYLILSSILLGFMAWIKNEGLALLIINVIIFFIYNLFLILKRKKDYREPFKHILYFSSIAFMIYVPWLITRIIYGLSDEYTSFIYILLDIGQLLENLSIIIGNILIIDYSLLLFWIVFFIILLINTKYLFKKERFFLLLLIIFHYLVYIGIYIITPLPIEFHISVSYDREILHLTPLFIFLIGLLLVENKNILIDFENKKLKSSKFLIYGFILIIIFFIVLDIFFVNLTSEFLGYYRSFLGGLYRLL